MRQKFPPLKVSNAVKFGKKRTAKSAANRGVDGFPISLLPNLLKTMVPPKVAPILATLDRKNSGLRIKTLRSACVKNIGNRLKPPMLKTQRCFKTDSMILKILWWRFKLKSSKIRCDQLNLQFDFKSKKKASSKLEPWMNHVWSRSASVFSLHPKKFTRNDSAHLNFQITHQRVITTAHTRGSCKFKRLLPTKVNFL